MVGGYGKENYRVIPRGYRTGESKAISLPLDTEGVDMICGGTVEVFIEVYINRPKLLIAGGGHVCYAIYNAALPLDFDIIIFDDREEFLNKERFPEAYDLVLGDIGKSLGGNYPIDENTYIVIVTRGGHKYDEEALAAVANTNAKYIGAMGSKKINNYVKESLNGGERT